jgi:hypothetical protein
VLAKTKVVDEVMIVVVAMVEMVTAGMARAGMVMAGMATAGMVTAGMAWAGKATEGIAEKVVNGTEVEAEAVPYLLLVSQQLGREDSDGGGEVGGGFDVKRMLEVAGTVVVSDMRSLMRWCCCHCGKGDVLPQREVGSKKQM